jgi:hypothetical protein
VDIIQLTKNFTEIAEWTRFCQAQSKQITTLTQEINELKEKNKQLEGLVGNFVPLIVNPGEKKSNLQIIEGLNDEEAIAVMEIAKLKEISLDRTLDPAETKQYEIYTKTLQLLRSVKKKPELLQAESLSDAEILKIVE